MKIEKIKVEGGFIAQNPMTGDWFVWIGDRRAADYICKNKRDAKQKAKSK